MTVHVPFAAPTVTEDQIRQQRVAQALDSPVGTTQGVRTYTWTGDQFVLAKAMTVAAHSTQTL